MHQHLVLKMKKLNACMMLLKEQWLIVTPNIKPLQEISMHKLELKKKKKNEEDLHIMK